jgi:hypothetical protein
VGTTTWFDSGSTEARILVVSYTIEFKAAPGWMTPASVVETIGNGATATATVTYIPQGNPRGLPWLILLLEN